MYGERCRVRFFFQSATTEHTMPYRIHTYIQSPPYVCMRSLSCQCHSYRVENSNVVMWYRICVIFISSKWFDFLICYSVRVWDNASNVLWTELSFVCRLIASVEIESFILARLIFGVSFVTINVRLKEPGTRLVLWYPFYYHKASMIQF